MFELTFISEVDFKNHVSEMLKSYNRALESLDLASFNSNVVDPIKLLFDKSVYRKSFEEVVKDEIQRQRGKTNTNNIGYFHQNIFKYIKNCIVPRSGWDVIFDNGEQKIFVEMKNKHNTMNSSSSQKTYMRMQNQILKTPNVCCFLVEVIAPHSRNIQWNCCVDGESCGDERIRRVSIDRFYEIVTGRQDAFFKLCMQLPITIDELMRGKSVLKKTEDTVIEELRKKNKDILKALYMLAFETYEGFSNL